MKGLGTTYVVDTNTLSQLGKTRRASTFFLEHARVPSEVLHEAAQFPDIEALRAIEAPTSADALRKLLEVMATIPPDDTSLVDLYANHGGADPLIIACALQGKDQEMQFLDPQEWCVVSGDKAVRAKANEFGLRSLTNEKFAALIDVADRPQSLSSPR
jgi:hypothetical protein